MGSVLNLCFIDVNNLGQVFVLIYWKKLMLPMGRYSETPQ
jgi:hypothetical protein